MSLRVLDTDIVSLYQRSGAVRSQRIQAWPPAELAITVITVEEQLTGWYTLIRRVTQSDRLAIAYQSLADTVPFLARFRILSYTEGAISRFEQLAAMKLNLGRMDLRIAAVTLECGGVLVTRNLRDS
jgi:tRNA(fMet)-specific endonuclease VapC